MKNRNEIIILIIWSVFLMWIMYVAIKIGMVR